MLLIPQLSLRRLERLKRNGSSPELPSTSCPSPHCECGLGLMNIAPPSWLLASSYPSWLLATPAATSLQRRPAALPALSQGEMCPRPENAIYRVSTSFLDTSMELNTSKRIALFRSLNFVYWEFGLATRARLGGNVAINIKPWNELSLGASGQRT